jgi:hypothetical protein
MEHSDKNEHILLRNGTYIAQLSTALHPNFEFCKKYMSANHHKVKHNKMRYACNCLSSLISSLSPSQLKSFTHG